VVPEVRGIHAFDEALKLAYENDLAIIPCLLDGARNIKEVLKDFRPKKMVAFIGPEGDFTPEEVQKAQKAGCIPVDLGQRVLRADTAALYVMSVVHFVLS
jgi:16S rRNA (uracil1498-N3)-methyltransferase